MYTGRGDSLGESTPLIRQMSGQHYDSQRVSLLSAPGGCYDPAHDFLRSVFSTGGLTICVRNATVITQPRLGYFFPKIWPPRLHCDKAVALMRDGGLHVVADIDGVAGLQLLRAMTGVTQCASGSVLADGIPVEAGVFRRAVGVISEVETAMPNLTVEDNINFVISIRTRVSQRAKEALVKAVCILTELDPYRKAKLLLPSERFRLRVAMELVRDPPILVAYYPLDNLGHGEAAECSSMLKRISTVLEKTVIISTRSLVTHLFEVADTALIFGRGGRVLYSGKARALPSYFNALPVHNENFVDQIHNTREGASSSVFTEISRVGSESPLRGSLPVDSQGANSPGTPSWRASGTERRIYGRGEDVVFSGDDALDLANFWAENEATTTFYADFFDAPGRRRLEQAMMHYAFPPQDIEGAKLFKGSTIPQYAVLKPFVLLWYDSLQVRRDPSVYIHFACLALGLLLISLLMHYQYEDQGGMYNIRGILFALFFFTVLSNAEVMNDIDGKLQLFFHQRESGLYNTLCFLIVLVLHAVAVRVVCLALFVPVVIFVIKMNAIILLLIGAVSVAHALVCIAVHVLLPFKSWAEFSLFTYAGYSIIFSGFLLNLKTMPPFVGSLSLLRWGYGAALEQNLRDKPFSCDGAQNTSYCYTGNAYLDIEGFSNDSTNSSLMVLGAISVVLLLLISVTLVFRH